LEKDDLKQILDLDAREIAIFAPLIVLAIVMGVYPGPFLDVMHVSVDNLIQQYQTAMQAAASGAAQLAAN
jgi:NADH-quinone oxidoreductase subunit M